MDTDHALKMLRSRSLENMFRSLWTKASFNALCKEMGEITVDVLKVSLDTKLLQRP